MKYFSTNDLPLNDEMINFWNNNGYLVIENFNTDKECDELMERSSYLIEHNNFNSHNWRFNIFPCHCRQVFNTSVIESY